MKWTKSAYLLLSTAMVVMGVFSYNVNDPAKAVVFVGVGIWVMLVALLTEG